MLVARSYRTNVHTMPCRTDAGSTCEKSLTDSHNERKKTISYYFIGAAREKRMAKERRGIVQYLPHTDTRTRRQTVSKERHDIVVEWT